MALPGHLIHQSS